MPQKNKDREERIDMEIVVDAYDESERHSGWSCYLGDHLQFPFEAKCIKARSVSPLKKGEQVTVLKMLEDESDNLSEMTVKIRWQGRTMGVPLAQLVGIDVDEETEEAIADWHYWTEQGYCF
jgi:hypothetical protein